MKALIIVLSFLSGIPIIAQGNNSFFNNPYQKFPANSYFITDNKTDSTIAEMNKYDIKYYELNLNVSKLSTEISGDATIYSQVKVAMLDTFYIQLIDTMYYYGYTAYMIVDSVQVNDVTSDFNHKNNLLKISINPSFPMGTYFYVKVFYHGDGYPAIWNELEYNCRRTYSSSEPFGARYWHPSKQILTDKADSVRIIITTDSDCLAGSNGLLKSTTILPDNKIKYEWISHYPIAYYLISFAVGQYIDYKTYMHINNSADSLLIQNYLNTNDPNLPTQLVAIEKVKENIQLFSNLFGQYPFYEEKYGHCIGDGGMENQTMTTIGSTFLDTSLNYFNYFPGWASAHELAHSWFGDNVTCGTWQDIWLNEGFATYGEYLAVFYNDSHEAADEFMNEMQIWSKHYPDGSVYVPAEYANDPGRIFSILSYYKGAAILHMIRFIVNNDSLFFQSLRNYETKFAGSTATGLDFKAVLDSKTSMDFTDFFNEWYFGQGYPVFNIYFNQNNDSLNFHSVQTTSSSATTLFKIPVELKLFYPGGDTTIKYFQDTNDISFSIISPHQITQVKFDPNHWLIADNVMHVTAVTGNSSEIRTYGLSQNYPNPFNPVTKIKFQIAHTGLVKLIIYDLLGRKVTALVNEVKHAGKYEVNFDGSKLPSGIYFYSFEAGNFKQVKKMILLK